jgi:hypothetical protein
MKLEMFGLEGQMLEDALQWIAKNEWASTLMALAR